MNSNNKSGVTGVSFDKKSMSWVTQWEDAESNSCHKRFSVKKYGNDNAKVSAIEHWARMLPHYRDALRLDTEA